MTSLKNTLSNLSPSYRPFVVKNLFEQHKKTIVFVADCEEDAITVYQQLLFLCPQIPCLFFPGWDCLPYDRVSPSNECMTQRLSVLWQLTQQTKPFIFITSIQALLQKVPPISLIQETQKTIHVGDYLNRSEFLDFLAKQGFRRQETVYEAGEFAVRGSLLDIFPTNISTPVRLDFFGDTLEAIRTFDALTQTTQNSIQSFNLGPVREVLLTPDSINNFKSTYQKSFPPNNHGVYDDPLYLAVTQGLEYAGAEHWLPFFYTNLSWVLDYIGPDAVLTYDAKVNGAMTEHLKSIQDYYIGRLNPIIASTTYHPISPELLYGQEQQWQQWLDNHRNYCFTPFNVPDSKNQTVTDIQVQPAPDLSAQRQKEGDSFFESLTQKLQAQSRENRRVIIISDTLGSQKRLEGILTDYDLSLQPSDSWPFKAPLGIYSLVAPFDTGFVSETDYVLTEQDILGYRLTRPQRKRSKSSVFQDASDLSTGDLIVHRDHGIGRYLGLETVTINNNAHDCLVLLYADDNKLFLPVENIDAISRYGSDSSLAQLDRLGSNAWHHRKDKVKKRIRIIADYLLKVAAERALHKAPALERIDTHYDSFCAGFPYTETEDQQTAIDDTLADMASGRPMDRLVCGDVGFGKTEVALRAAYIAASHGKQVAVVVPTTLLCRQHFQNFTKRFQGTPFKVAQLSRLVRSPDRVRADLASGNIRIIIATHTILSEKTKFHDLGLLIVDEEQHFGVKQKESLKKLKADVHVLTLTATPIPRTLQLALGGVRELSLMTTPPVDRLAVRTFITPFDPVVIREAILREYHRGGQIFYVCPYIEDLEDLSNQLKKLVPEIKFAIAHGQLPTTDLENIVGAFYDHEYHLLLSTNIIESGIDIPTANTLIVHNADRMGLAQLYQLRGRVGRSKTQAYAYLTFPPHKALTANAEKRLHVMQSLDTLGAGFRVASHDLDIRGAGNIVGEEQSGHIREVGVELYQTLLHEAIMMARANQVNKEEGFTTEEWSPQINIGSAILIPELYVADLGLRLNLYRRVGALKTKEEIEAFAAELIDRFGPLPQEVNNLITVIELKTLCRRSGIEKLEVGPKGLTLSFRNNTFSNQPGLMEYLQKPEVHKPGPVKIRPDQKLVFMRQWPNEEAVLRNTKNILGNLAVIAAKG